MPYHRYTEEDPLLPGHNRSPEIQTSRPPSLKEQRESRPEQPQTVVASFATTVLGLCFIVLLFIMLAFSGISEDDFFKYFKPWPRTIEGRVNRILTETPLIDGHNDLAIFIRFYSNNHIYDDNFTKPFEQGGMPRHVDLPRLKEGKNGGAFWSAFVPCPHNGSDFSDSNYADFVFADLHNAQDSPLSFSPLISPALPFGLARTYSPLLAVAFTLSQIDLLARLQIAYPTRFSPPPNSSTALSAFKSGQLISPFAIEGLHQIGNSVSNLRLYHSLGVRYATLTHNCHNIYADAALTENADGHAEIATPKWGGVSPAGKGLIHEMNRLGMIVDLAHTSQDTMRDVLGGTSDWDGSAAPPIFSHSSAYALCPHPRNVPDDILQLVKKKNSIVMVNFSPGFISCVANPSDPSGLPDFYPANSTLEHVVRHIMHIGDLIGYDHVGLGSDFDGIGSTPSGLDDVSKFPDLVAELVRQRVSNEDAAKIVGGNILRVWRDVDKVAARLQKSGDKPLEDKLPSLIP